MKSKLILLATLISYFSYSQEWILHSTIPTSQNSNLFVKNEKEFLVFDNSIFWLSNDSAKNFNLNHLTKNSKAVSGGPNLNFFNKNKIGFGFCKEVNNPNIRYLFFSENLDQKFKLIELGERFSLSSQVISNPSRSLIFYKIGVDSNSVILPRDSIFELDTLTDEIIYFDVIQKPKNCIRTEKCNFRTNDNYYALFKGSLNAEFNDALYYFDELKNEFLLKRFSTELNDFFVLNDTTLIVSDNRGGLEISFNSGANWKNISVGEEKMHSIVPLGDSSFVLYEIYTYTAVIKEPTKAYITNNWGKSYTELSFPQEMKNYQEIQFESGSQRLYFKFLTNANLFRTYSTYLTSIPIKDTLTSGAHAATGINNEFNLNEISLFPNPAQNQIAIKGIKPNAAYQVYNALGVLVYQNKSTTNQNFINTSNFNNGLYFLVCNQNNNLITRRFVVSK